MVLTLWLITAYSHKLSTISVKGWNCDWWLYGSLTEQTQKSWVDADSRLSKTRWKNSRKDWKIWQKKRLAPICVEACHYLRKSHQKLLSLQLLPHKLPYPRTNKPIVGDTSIPKKVATTVARTGIASSREPLVVVVVTENYQRTLRSCS